MAWDSLGARGQLTVGEVGFGIHRLGRIDGADQLPYSLKVMLENLPRNEDGRLVTAEQVEALAHWQPRAEPPDRVHPGAGADAGLHRGALCGRPGRDARRHHHLGR